jgi:hypothetical protein
MSSTGSRNAALQRLEPFVGEWSVEALFPGAPRSDLRARTVFELILDRQFLMERSEIPLAEAPDGVSIIQFDPETGAYTQHYFDSRGVVRIYAMTFEDGVWTLLREKPDFTPLNFSQRFTGTFSPDSNRIDGRWEKTSGDGSDWELDFGLVYEKVT